MNAELVVSRRDPTELTTDAPSTTVLLATTALLASVPSPVRSADANPAIAGIRPGMAADEVKAKLKELSPRTLYRTYRSTKADGTGDFIRGLSINIDSGEPGEGYNAQDRVGVVFNQFSGGAEMVMRWQTFPRASLPGLAPINAAVANAYGTVLKRESTMRGPSFVGLAMRDRDGKETHDTKCVYTTTGNSVGGMLMEGMNTWTDFYPQCGVLVRVEVTPSERDEAIASGMQQRMADTQAILQEIGERERIGKAAADERAKAERAHANAVAVPRL